MRTSVATLVLFAASIAHAADASFEEKALGQELKALEQGSFSGFTAQGDVKFKAMPEAEFQKATAKFAPLLKAGYKSTYLGVFKEEAGMLVHYWRLEFSSESHDWLAKMAVKDEHIAGFFITRP